MSSELTVRLRNNPRLSQALSALPPKMLALRSDAPAAPITFEEPLEGHVERVIARIQCATFTGKGDAETVPALYTAYVARVAGALQPLLALGGGEAAAAVPLPPIPTDATAKALQTWHLEVMRAQHSTIFDALSGKRLDTRTQCVAMAVEGRDPGGRTLPVRDAATLFAWLQDTAKPALLTAGPAAGKTWLLSQVVVHALGCALVPILVEVQLLKRSLEANDFASVTDWVDEHLRLTHKPPHYGMLRAARAEKRALLLLDGLDEAGEARARIEQHVATALADHRVLCTSRPTGLNEALFANFCRLTLAPLGDAQQHTFLMTRLTPARAAELAPYLRGMPLDAETQHRVTANQLMLSMIASIADLHTGVAMHTRVADLYETASKAMLQRGTVSDAAAALLQATFFEAHAAQQRVITEEHLQAAARLGAAAELRSLVANDQLPLVRLLQKEPLQMQAFHLSFQEYYAMRAVRDGASLPKFEWDAWWTNAVLMGVQTGDAFGERFAQATGLEAPWRRGVVAALVEQGLPAAWLPTAVEAARGADVAPLVAPLAANDALTVGRRVLAFNIIWRSGVVTRVGDTIAVDFGGADKSDHLPPTQALVIASDGAGALLRVAAGAGDAALVRALLATGVSALVADARANTPLHVAAAAGHVDVCRLLRDAGADPDENNQQNQTADNLARTHKQHTVVRLFNPTLSDREFTPETCATERLRAAAQGDVAALKRTKDAGKITALMVACRAKQRAAVEALTGAEIDAQSDSGCTALYLAAEEGDHVIVALLLSRNANVALAASDGGAPLHRACEFGHEQV